MNSAISIAQIIVPAITALVSIFLTYVFTARKVKLDLNNKALQNRYHKVYTPMRQAFLGIHIARFSSGETLRTRFIISMKAVKTDGLKNGLQKLFKKKIKIDEYEAIYGEFPMNKIRKISIESGNWADSKLLKLIQHADYADNERFDIKYNSAFNPDSILTPEEVKLMDHIYSEYEKLNNRLLPKS